MTDSHTANDRAMIAPYSGTQICPSSVIYNTVHTPCAPLQRDSASSANFLMADGDRQTDLAGHACSADDGPPQAQLLDEGRNDAHVAVFGVRVRARW